MARQVDRYEDPDSTLAFDEMRHVFDELDVAQANEATAMGKPCLIYFEQIGNPREYVVALRKECDDNGF